MERLEALVGSAAVMIAEDFGEEGTAAVAAALWLVTAGARADLVAAGEHSAGSLSVAAFLAVRLGVDPDRRAGECRTGPR